MTPRKVALLIETSNAYARGLLQGITGYLRERGPWSVYLAEQRRGDSPPHWLADWNGDGVIARIENVEIARVLSKLRVPIVDVSAARPLPKLPCFEIDEEGVGRLAAAHFIERGFKNFGFCGNPRFVWSNSRGEQFMKIVRAAGHSVSNCQLPRGQDGDDEADIEHIGRWVASLPKPVGILACYDFLGQQVLDACRLRGIAVPDEVAVLGVDNDDLLCNLCHPPMSSVIPNMYLTGYRAAELLDRLMAGEKHQSEMHFIEPLGIATRQSTETLAIEDINLVRAIRFIRDRACDGISVKDILRAVPQSRRVLEGRFKKLVGRTPHEEILRVQLARAKVLLAETQLSMAMVAERSGFAHVEYFSAVFKRETGLPPSRYRHANRRSLAAALPSI